MVAGTKKTNQTKANQKKHNQQKSPQKTKRKNPTKTKNYNTKITTETPLKNQKEPPTQLTTPHLLPVISSEQVLLCTSFQSEKISAPSLALK